MVHRVDLLCSLRSASICSLFSSGDTSAFEAPTFLCDVAGTSDVYPDAVLVFLSELLRYVDSCDHIPDQFLRRLLTLLRERIVVQLGEVAAIGQHGAHR